MAEKSTAESEEKGREKEQNDDHDLRSLLNESQRGDLTLLVANLTESMRKLVLDNFDAAAGLDKSLLREGMTEDEKLMASDPATADVGKYEREQKLKEESDKNLSTLKMKNLKKNALKSYDDWREHVIERVGQVVNSERAAKDQVQKTAGKSDNVSKPQAPPTTIGRISEVPNKMVNLKFKDLYPPTKTPLTKMPMNQRTLILHSLLLLLLSLEHYNAFSRILMLNLTSSLKLPLRTFEQDEYTTAKGLLEAAKEMSADTETKKKADENKESRKWKVGLATAAGAAIIGVTGGYAAPLVSAGVGSVMGGLGLGATTAASYLGTVAGSSLLVGGLFGAYGGRMTGQMMDNYAREVEDFQFLPVHARTGEKTSEDEKEGAEQASDHDHKLRVTICISGWLREKEEVVKPWRVLGTGAEVFALKYELEALLRLGNAMDGMVQSAAWGYAQKQFISSTIFADLAAAMWPIALMKVARVIDNPFSLAKGRSEKAGEVLADALVNRAQGERPVTLIGYSLGARVIYTCLMSLAKRKAFGLVENAVLIGAPTPSDTSDWRILRSVVAGRLINVFSTNDYVLGFMYRTSAIQYGVAGLQKVEGLAGVENVDVSEDVSGHLRYRYLIGNILKKIGFEDIDMRAVEEEREELLKMEEEEKKQSIQSQRRWLTRRESTGGKADEAAEGEAEAEELEKKVQDQTQKSLVTRAIEYFYTPGVPDTKDADRMKRNLEKAAQDPSKTGAVAGKTAEDVQNSAQSYATMLYSKLPSMPYASHSTATGITDKASQAIPLDAKKTTDQVSKQTDKLTGQKQSYVQQASSYLPSLPSVPSLRGSTLQQSPNDSKTKPKKKTKEDTKTQPEKAVETATKTAETTGSAAKDAAGIVSDTLTPTVKNALNPKDNPAVKSAQQVSNDAPVLKQANENTPAPVKNATGEVSNAVGTTVQNTGQTVQKGVDTSSDKAKDVGKAVTDSAGNAGKNASSATTEAAKTGQSYTSRAASYLPGMPRIPSMGFGGGGDRGSGGKSAAAAEKPGSKPASRPAPPKLGKRTSSSKAITKDTDTPDTNSLPKLDRFPSGLKSPIIPTRLDSISSGVKSPPTSVPTPNLIRRVSSIAKDGGETKEPQSKSKVKSPGQGGLKSPPPKLGPRKSSGQQGRSRTQLQEPSPAELGRKLSSLVGGEEERENGAQKPAKKKESQSATSPVPTPSAPAAGAGDAAKGAADSATSNAKAGADRIVGAGKGVAKQGGGMLGGVGNKLGLGGK